MDITDPVVSRPSFLLCWLDDIFYTLARSFYAVMALAAVVVSIIWSPVAGLVGVLLLQQAATRIEEVPALERRCLQCQQRRLSRRRSGLGFVAHPEDIHLLLYNVIFFAAYALAFWAYLRPGVSGLSTPLLKLTFCVGVGYMLGWAAGVNLGVSYHNHLHRGIFRSRIANEWFGRLWTLPSGWPAYFWKYKHMAVHHKHVHEERDWVQPRRKADGTYENIYVYILLHWPWRYYKNFWWEFRTGRNGRRRKMLAEFAPFALVWSIPFWIDPMMGLGLWLFPQWIGSALVLGSGMYTQHVGGNNDQEYSHSTTFLSRFFNLTMFNVGYHTEHHDHPDVHWSELPALHERIKHQLIAGGAHVVAYGSYHATLLLNSVRDPAAGLRVFLQQHPEYRASRMDGRS